jgi:serine protease AprX
MSKYQRFMQIFIAIVFLMPTVAVVPQRTGEVSLPGRAQPRLVQLAMQDGDREVAVIVQKADQGDRVEKLAAELGGQMTKDLQIINAFAAEMSAKAALELAQDEGVRWVSLDAPMERSEFSELSAVDNFDFRAYDNQDGMINWSSDWQEYDVAGPGPAWGNIEIYKGMLWLNDNPDTGTQPSLARGVDLSGYVDQATLSFDLFAHYGVDYGSDIAVVEISVDGGQTYTLLEVFDYLSGGYFGHHSYDIQPYASADTKVRFRITQNFGGRDEWLVVDNLRIEYNLFSPAFSYTYHETTGVSQLHADGLTGSGIGVAVIDSGIDAHPDFDGRLTRPQGYPTADNYGHGTHVAGIVGGGGAASNGAYQGVAPGVQLIDLNITDEYGMAYESDVINALQWVNENKELYNIRVVNMSLNSTLENSYHESPLSAASEIVWFNGVTVVASVGNKGPGGGHNTSKTAPANDPFLIVVGASDEHDTADRLDDQIGAFSSFGITYDGYLRPNLVAPGFNIVSALSADSSWDEEAPHRVDGQYIHLSGTSMAAPLVAGVAALILEHDPSLTPDQVKYRLLNSGSTITNEEYSFPYLDAYAAVYSTSTESANVGAVANEMLWTGDDPVTWGSVAWNSVAWNSVAWNSVAWNSVAWNSVAWNSSIELDGIFWGGRGGNGKGTGGGKK